MHGKRGVVGLHYSIRHFRGRKNRKRHHHSVGILLPDLGDQQCPHARSSPSSQRVAHLKPCKRKYSVHNVINTANEMRKVLSFPLEKPHKPRTEMWKNLLENRHYNSRPQEKRKNLLQPSWFPETGLFYSTASSSRIPCKQSQLSASFRTTSRTESISSAPSV